MVASLLTGQEESSALARILHPDPLADGSEPESRLIVCGMSWDRYLALDRTLGDDRPGPRFYYLSGDLEIMTTSNEHERIKQGLGEFLAEYVISAKLDLVPRGTATRRQTLKQAGAQPAQPRDMGGERGFAHR